jgi:hypothetical protein
MKMKMNKVFAIQIDHIKVTTKIMMNIKRNYN